MYAEKDKGLSYGAWIPLVVCKGTVNMVCDRSYQPNFDDNIGVVAWGINCTETDG